MNKAYKFFIFQFKIKFNLENGKRKTNEFKGKFNGDKKETEKLQYENLMIKIQIVKLNQNRMHKKKNQNSKLKIDSIGCLYSKKSFGFSKYN